MCLFAACLQYAVLPNAVFFFRPRMNVCNKAWLPHPTPNPQWGGGVEWLWLSLWLVLQPSGRDIPGSVTRGVAMPYCKHASLA